MEKIVLNAELRDSTECVRDLRDSKVIPCVVYGKGTESTSVKLGNSDLLRAFRVVWKNEVVSLVVNGKTMDVKFHDIQRQPVSDEFLHIDFLVV